MSDLNKETVIALSKLCRIQLTEKETLEITHDLKKILDYVEQLQKVDVSSITPYSHLEEQGLDSLRQDVCKNSLSRELFLENSPDQIGGMVRTPPIIKQNVQNV